jgi:hypothetical protein
MIGKYGVVSTLLFVGKKKPAVQTRFVWRKRVIESMVGCVVVEVVSVACDGGGSCLAAAFMTKLWIWGS